MEKLVNKGGLTEKELHSKGQRRAERGGACFSLLKSFNGKRFPKFKTGIQKKNMIGCLVYSGHKGMKSLPLFYNWIL